MLTDAKARSAKPAKTPYKLPDAGGLHLHVATTGLRTWRWRYEVAGREKLLTIGQYPEMGLSTAREARDDARRLLRAGRDPGIEKRLRKAATIAADGNTFEAMARDWHRRQLGQWTKHHGEDVIRSLENDVFPLLGPLPVTEITAPMVVKVLRAIEARPAIETAHRVRQRMSAVFVHAVALGICQGDPAAVVKGAMAPVPAKTRQPAITDLAGARQMLRDVEAPPAFPVTKLAMRWLALTAVRPGEVHGAAWAELEDLDGPEPLWVIPKERMKMRREHLVPLPRQAVDVVRAVHAMTGKGPLMFPNTRYAHRPMTANALGYLLNRVGYHGRHVPHGWRSTFSTIMNERHRPDRAVIDLMLAHAPEDTSEAAYNRALHLGRRRELAQDYADLLLDGFPPAHALLEGRRRRSPG